MCAVAIGASASIPLIMGCGSKSSEQEIRPTETVVQYQQGSIDQVYNNLWTADQLLIYKHENEVLEKKLVEIGSNSKDYRGPSPLRFTIYSIPFGMFEDIDLVHEFDGFENFFIQDIDKYGPILRGAQTYDENRNLLAEMKIEYTVLANGTKQANMYEVHYDLSGKIIFEATSIVDGSGAKKEEIWSNGTKRTEYYFFVPIEYMQTDSE